MTAYLRLGGKVFVLDDVAKATPIQGSNIVALIKQNDQATGYVALVPGDFITWGAAPKEQEPDQQGQY